jgi:hypothetical protein
MDYTFPTGIYHENGWFEICDPHLEGAWLATDSPVPLLP